VTYSPTVVYMGRRKLTPDDLYADLPVNWLRGYAPNHSSANAWYYAAKFRAGRVPGGGNAWVRPLVYMAEPAGSGPDDLDAVFNPVTVTNSMDDHSDSEEYTTYLEGGLKGFLVPINGHRGLVLHTRLNGARVNMQQSSMISGAEDEDFYDRTGYSSTTPPDPMGHGTPHNEGHLTFWLVGDVNYAPLAPTSVVPSGDQLSLTPTIEAVFQDYNGAAGGIYDRGDLMTKARIEVRRKSDQVSFWALTYSVSPAEATANKSSKVYGVGGGSTTLVRGTTYQVRVSHWDSADAQGQFSSWIDFTPSALGTVTLTGAPTGKVNDLSPDVNWTWNHTTALSANRVKFHFYKGGIEVATSSEVVVSVANGASTTTLWSSMGIGSNLEAGQPYTVRVEARDTNSVWSALSSPRSFNTDAAPGVPINLSPSGGIVLPSSSYPKLYMTVTDADADTLTVKGEILTGAGSLISTRTFTRIGTTDQYEYQTVAGDLASVGNYKFRGYAFDGFLYSGGGTVEASATRSAEALFTWAAVPAVTITDPSNSEVVDSSTPPATWTVSAQDKYRIRWIRVSDSVEVYSTGWITDSVLRTHSIPAGYTKNGEVYNVEVGVERLGLQGFATATNVVITYTPPPSPANLTVAALTVGDEPFPTAAEITFTAYAGSNFRRTVVYRSDLSRPLAHLDSSLEDGFIDYHAPINGPTYSVGFVEVRGIEEEVESELSAAVLPTLPIRGIVMVSIQQPSTDRFVSPAWDDVEFTMEGEEEEFLTWGATAPISKRGIADYFEGEISARIVPEVSDPLALKAGIEGIARSSGASYRDRDGFRKFMRIPKGGLSIARMRYGGYEVNAELREIGWIEGVVE
jgi:hypothetical protein